LEAFTPLIGGISEGLEGWKSLPSDIPSYRNGSGSKYVLSNSEGLYYLPSYFGKAQMVDDMDSAKKLWLREEFDLKDGGNYY